MSPMFIQGPMIAAAEITPCKRMGISVTYSSSASWKGSNVMNLSVTHLQPLVALAAGILILIMPRLLNYIVAIYLIVVGIVGLGLIK
jgi:Protein of unknown function (DUF3096)